MANQQKSFPQNTELPEIIDSSNWSWQQVSQRTKWSGMNPDWWIGKDDEGVEWLVKMTGGLASYREHVFTSLAQRLGISCQSSTYLLLGSKMAESRLCPPISESFQLAILFMSEHGGQKCKADCPSGEFYGKEMDYSEALKLSDEIAFLEDMVQVDILGHLCGQTESSDHFLTSNHEYVSIDHELMFTTLPSLHSCHWCHCESAQSLVLEVCRKLAHVEDIELIEFAKLPDGYVVSGVENLYADLICAKTAATDYFNMFEDFM